MVRLWPVSVVRSMCPGCTTTALFGPVEAVNAPGWPLVVPDGDHACPRHDHRPPPRRGAPPPGARRAGAFERVGGRGRPRRADLRSGRGRNAGARETQELGRAGTCEGVERLAIPLVHRSSRLLARGRTRGSARLPALRPRCARTGGREGTHPYWVGAEQRLPDPDGRRSGAGARRFLRGRPRDGCPWRAYGRPGTGRRGGSPAGLGCRVHRARDPRSPPVRSR